VSAVPGGGQQELLVLPFSLRGDGSHVGLLSKKGPGRHEVEGWEPAPDAAGLFSLQQRV
jgi:hypothetical protein